MTVKEYYNIQIIRILFSLKWIFVFTVIGVLFITTTCSKPTESEEQELPRTLWTKTFGGSHYDRGYSVHQTSDDGYIITGETKSYGAGENDLWLIKTDVSGDELWTNTFGGTSSDGGNSVQETSDGGYIITGYTESYGSGKRDIWLIKTDELGNTMWTKTFGGNDHDKGYCVKQTSDDGYIITGETKSYGAGEYDLWLIKTDVSGDTGWTRTFGGVYTDVGKSVQQTFDGGYIVTGWTEWTTITRIEADIWLIKMDESGNEIWTKDFRIKPSHSVGNSVQQTSNGGYIIVGTIHFLTQNPAIFLIRVAPD